MKCRITLCAAAFVTLLHVAVFTKYAYDPNPNSITRYGEMLKTLLPLVLLTTLIPFVYKPLDTILRRRVVNIAGTLIVLASLYGQIVLVPGQAWSTMAFSAASILVLYNYLLDHNNLGSARSLILSLMVVWAGWVMFEFVFHTGQWFYHPEAYGHNLDTFLATIKQLIGWAIPPTIYVTLLLSEHKTLLHFNKASSIALGVGAAATAFWFGSGMLIPVPNGPDGLPYLLSIKYMSAEHLQFAVSRLSQVSVTAACALMFVKHV